MEIRMKVSSLLLVLLRQVRWASVICPEPDIRLRCAWLFKCQVKVQSHSPTEQLAPPMVIDQDIGRAVGVKLLS